MHLCQNFSGLSEAKLKEVVITGPNIRKLISDANFGGVMNNLEQKTRVSFREVISNFLGTNYKQILSNIIIKFKKLGYNMSLRILLLDSLSESYPENSGMLSEKQGERFHQDIKKMK